MIRTRLVLSVRPEHTDGLVEVFEERGILVASLGHPGCLAAELSTTQDGRWAQVTSLWHDDAAYRSWTSRGDRSDHVSAITPHLRSELAPAEVWRVRLLGDERL